MDYEIKRLRKVDCGYKGSKKLVENAKKSKELLLKFGDEFHRRSTDMENEKITPNNKVWLSVAAVICVLGLFIYNSHSIRTLTYEIGMQAAEIEALQKQVGGK